MPKQSRLSREPRSAGTPTRRTSLEERRAILIASARLLAYPDRTFWLLLSEIEAHLRELPSIDPVCVLLAVIERLRATGVIELEARYVATFDFNESAALHLTAHELGDSRRRGQALVELRAMLRAAGFTETTGELPDYLPLLLELLAHAPGDMMMDQLERRLAVVCEQISTRLDAESPYRDIFLALRATLPTPTDPRSEQRFAHHEQADTGEMPYPLRYE